MATLGIEFNDVGFQAAICANTEPQLLALTDNQAGPEWPGFAFHNGQKFSFGRVAEEMWFVHPRSVTHTFWSKLTHEPAGLNLAGKVPSSSELAYYFLREFMQRLNALAGSVDKVVFAVPGAYLKDESTEEEKIGLLLGMAGELKIPLAGVIDLSCAALCDSRAGGFSPTLPVIVLDVQLQGAELTQFSVENERVSRRRFLSLPQSGFAQLLKHLTSSMGNRFLRHTAFDILEDGRIEQAFYRQTKNFLLSGMPEFRFQINTAKRNYELLAKREKLEADAHGFVVSLVQAAQTFARGSSSVLEPCTMALTERAAALPGIEVALRGAGFHRVLHLPAGAAAMGAARIGAARLSVASDISDVSVETSVPLADASRAVGAPWEARLIKSRAKSQRPEPTHAILEGVGHSLTNGHFTVGAANAGVDLPLPESFNAANDCVVQLVREGGRLWFAEPAAPRTAVEAGDRLAIRCGGLAAEVLFAHCEPNG